MDEPTCDCHFACFIELGTYKHADILALLVKITAVFPGFRGQSESVFAPKCTRYGTELTRIGRRLARLALRNPSYFCNLSAVVFSTINLALWPFCRS